MSPKTQTFLKRWLVDTLAVLVAVIAVDGIECNSMGGLLVASLLLGILNAFLRPLLLLLSLPLLIFSLGLFALIINAFLLSFVGWLVDPFEVKNFWAAFWGGLIISVVSMVGNSMLGTNRAKAEVRTQKSRRDGGASPGPIIDV